MSAYIIHHHGLRFIMLFCVSVVHSFLLLYGYFTICLFIHLFPQIVFQFLDIMNKATPNIFAYLCMDICFYFSEAITWELIFWVYDKFVFNFIRTFPKWLCHFKFPLTMYGSTSFSKSPLTLGIVNCYNFSHSSKCVMWYLMVICSAFLWCLMVLTTFSCAYWSFAYILSSLF